MRRILACVHRRRAMLVGLVTILLAATFAPVAVGATGTLDQFYVSGDVTGFVGVGGVSPMIAQVFTAGITGTLTEVDLHMEAINTGSSPLTVQLQTVPDGGGPSGTVIGSASVPAGKVPLYPNQGWVPVTISAPSVAGTQYAIVLSNPGGIGGYQVDASLQPGEQLYQGGALWVISAHPEDRHWSSFTPVEAFFRTFVTPSTVLVGDQKVEGFADSNPAGTAEAFQHTAQATGTAMKVGFYVDATNTASQISIGLYANSAGGHPGALLAQGSMSTPVNGQWNTATLGTGVSLTQGTKYWIAIVAPSGTITFRDKQYGGKEETSAETNLTGLPATWHTGQIFTNSPLSAFAF
jgi:hypothetical protein